MPKEIDSRWVDIDFPSENQYVFGALAPSLFGFEDYETVASVLSDDEILEEIERIEGEDTGAEQLISRIYNQASEGSCVANACGAAHEIIQAIEVGTDNVVPLSAMSLYKRIARSAQSGALVSDGLKEMAARGFLPLDTSSNREKYGNAVMPNTGWNTRFPADWQATAKWFRSLEWLRISSPNAYYSALVRREPIVVGRDGHSVCHCVPILYKNRRASQYVNSWGNWGFGDGSFSYGFGVDTEATVRKSINNGCFALRANVYRPIQ